MRVYVKGVPYMGMTTDLSDKELMIIVQASQRGLVRAKIRVTYLGESRYLSVEAIDFVRTCPSVVFSSETCLLKGEVSTSPCFFIRDSVSYMLDVYSNMRTVQHPIQIWLFSL